MNVDNLTGEFDLQIPFKGSRDYVQGPDLVEAAVQHLGTDNFDTCKFSSHFFINTPNCTLIVSHSKPDKAVLKSSPFRGQFKVSGVEYFIMINANEDLDLPIAPVPFDENLITDKCAIDGDHATIMGSMENSLTELFVSMKKHLLQNRYPDVDAKWIFTAVEYTQHPVGGEKFEVVIEHNLQNKLIKSRILVDDADIGYLYFSSV